METTSNSLNWFEIPVTDMQRAKHFYQVIFSVHMDEKEMMGMQMALFPYENGSGRASGALVKSDQHRPSKEGIGVPECESFHGVDIGKNRIDGRRDPDAKNTDLSGNWVYGILHRHRRESCCIAFTELNPKIRGN